MSAVIHYTGFGQTDSTPEYTQNSTEELISSFGAAHSEASVVSDVVVVVSGDGVIRLRKLHVCMAF